MTKTFLDATRTPHGDCNPDASQHRRRLIADAIRAPHGDKLGFYPPCTAIPPDVELRCPTSGGILWYVGGLSRAEWQRVTYAANLSVPIYKGMDAQN